MTPHFKVGDVVWLAKISDDSYSYGVEEVVLLKRTPCTWKFRPTRLTGNIEFVCTDVSKSRRLYKTREEAAAYVDQYLLRRYHAAKEVWKRRHAALRDWRQKHNSHTSLSEG